MSADLLPRSPQEVRYGNLREPIGAEPLAPPCPEGQLAAGRPVVSARLDARGDPSLLSIAESFNTTAAALERRVGR